MPTAMTDRTRGSLLCVALLQACVVRGSAGSFETATSSTTSTGGDDTTVSASSSSSGGANTGTGIKLDVENPDLPTQECLSIQQSTTIVERPSDIVVFADDATSVVLVRDIITNLLPAIETEGVSDAKVVLVVGGEPPPLGSDAMACGAWNCRGAADFPAFEVVDHPIAAGSQLTDLLAVEDTWSAHLRDASWKHLWALTGTERDDGLGADAFLEMLGEGEFVVHATVSADGMGDPDGFLGLAERTGGVYAQGDFNLGDFQGPMIERIQATALACEYDIPPPPGGLVFDAGRVNVDYDAGAGLEVIGQAESAEACANLQGNGWYYDQPVDPDRIIMCPQTCAAFEAAQNASIEIRFGCSTVPAA